MFEKVNKLPFMDINHSFIQKMLGNRDWLHI